MMDSHHADYILHFLVAAGGAGIGLYVRNMCKHLHHKIIVGTILLMAETWLTIQLVG